MDKKKLKVVLEVLDNVPVKHPKTTHYIENNLLFHALAVFF